MLIVTCWVSVCTCPNLAGLEGGGERREGEGKGSEGCIIERRMEERGEEERKRERKKGVGIICLFIYLSYKPF